MLVYCVTNNVNGKIYVGATRQDVRKYWLQNIVKARNGDGSKPLLYRAMRKHSPENFSIMVLVEAADEKQMFALEKFFIRTLESQNRDIGYNLSSGGEGSSFPRSEKQKKAVSEANTGRVFSPETRLRMSLSHLGKKNGPPSQEHRDKISLSKKGIPPSPQTIAASVKATSGKKLGPRSLEIRAKIGRSNRKQISEEQLMAMKNKREEGSSYYEISKIFGMNRTTLKRILTNDYLQKDA